MFYLIGCLIAALFVPKISLGTHSSRYVFIGVCIALSWAGVAFAATLYAVDGEINWPNKGE